MCVSTVLRDRKSRSRDRAVGAALGDEREHLALALGQLVERASRALARDQARDDRRVDHALALVDAPQRVDEHGDVGDALLEQVAGALRAPPRAAAPRSASRGSARARARRRPGGGGGSPAPRRARRRRGRAACGCRRSRRPGCRASTMRSSASASPQPARRPRSPRPRAAARGPRAAAPRRRRSRRARHLQLAARRTVDRDASRRRAPTRSSDLRSIAPSSTPPAAIVEPQAAVFGDGVDGHVALGQAQRPRAWRSRPPTRRASGKRPVGQAAWRRAAATARRARRAAARRPSSASTAGNRPWATLAQRRRPPRARCSSADGRGSRRARVAGRDPAPREPDGEGDRDQALLRAVVQVALERAALGVGGGDDPRARRAQLLEPGTPGRVQALVLERKAAPSSRARRQSCGSSSRPGRCTTASTSSAGRAHERDRPVAAGR